MRAERLEREFEIDIVWRPYELHPEIPAAGIDRGERASRLDGYVNPLRALAEEAGLPYAPSSHVPNSHRALEAAEFAREQGAFEQFHRALFEAYFGRGEDIGDVDVLVALAAASGLDAHGLEAALRDSRYTTLVNESTQEAQRQGVTGTPTYIFEAGDRRFPLVGAQDYSVFQSIAQRIGAEAKAS